jgi:hypothetical protein
MLLPGKTSNDRGSLQISAFLKPDSLGYCDNLGQQWCNFAYALINGSKPPISFVYTKQAAKKLYTRLRAKEWQPCQSGTWLSSQDTLYVKTRCSF